MEVSPLEFSSALLINQWKTVPGEKEFTLMQIKISGSLNNQPQTITYNLFDTGNPATKTSSMSRTTGFSCAASLHLIMDGLFTEKGVFPPELVGKHENCFQFIMQYLKDRNVIYEMK